MLGAAPRTRYCVVLVISAAVAVATPAAGYARPHQAKLPRGLFGSAIGRVVTPRTGGARVVGVVRLASWRSVAAIGASRADTQRPTRPTGLAVATAGQTILVLTWVASTDNVGVAGYGVYENGSLVALPATTGYTLAGLTCGTSYTVAVDAYDAAGNHSEKATITASTAACSDVIGAVGAVGVVVEWGWPECGHAFLACLERQYRRRRLQALRRRVVGRNRDRDGVHLFRVGVWDGVHARCCRL